MAGAASAVDSQLTPSDKPERLLPFVARRTPRLIAVHAASTFAAGLPWRRACQTTAVEAHQFHRDKLLELKCSLSLSS